MSSKIKKLEEKRNIPVSRISETYVVAVKAKDDSNSRSEFKSRFENIEKHYSEFESVHNKIIGELTEADDFSAQDAIRKKVDSYYYCIKAIYSDLFPPSSRESPETLVSFNKDNAKLPKISIPTFDGNYKNWQTFIDLFTSLIHTNSSLSDIEKFQYLLSFVQKEPFNLLKTIPLTSTNYKIAFDTLVKRYKNKRVLATTALNSIDSVSIKSGSAKEIRVVLDTFSENIAVLRDLEFPVDQWDFLLFNKLLQKIESKLRTDFEISVGNKEMPTYQDLFSFLEKNCKALEALQHMPSQKSVKPPPPVFRNQYNVSGSSKSNFPSSSFVSTITNIKCQLCNLNHVLSKCPTFLKKNPRERFSYVKQKGLCINCLHHAHVLKNCSSTFRCRTCNDRHHSLLHVTDNSNKRNSNSTSSSADSSMECPTPITSSEANPKGEPSTNSLTTTLKHKTVLLSTAVVEIRDGRGHFQPVRLLLDSASQANFISESCLRRLGLPREQLSIPVFGISQMSSSLSNGRTQCCIKPKGSPEPIFTFEALVLPRLCSYMPSMKIDIREWNHIRNLDLSDEEFHIPGSVDLLLGCELFPHILKGDIVHGQDGQASAINTVFGFILLGKIENPTSNFFSVSTFLGSTDTPLDVCMRNFWEIEEVTSKPFQSPDDSACESIFSSTVSRTNSGRFIVSLPFKVSDPDFGNTYPMALRRFYMLESRLIRNPVLYQAYSDFMKDYLDSGHMVLVDKSLPNNSQEGYFIPHHGIFQPKIRVVFDGSAKGPKGISLNDTLYTGPKLQQDIRDILLHFRVHAVVFTTDIKQMFRQILIIPSHTHFQKILWRFSSNDPVQTYCLQTVTYGLRSSPYLAIRTLQELANIESQKFPKASKILLEDIFVDDILTGTHSLESAIEVQNELIALLQLGGFQLKKWASNRPELISSFPSSDVSVPLSFDKTEPNFVKVLGLQWNPVSDTFSYFCHPDDKPCTKRTVLSQIARIFDPLGFCSPVSLLAKHLMQQLWASKIDWDDLPPPSIVNTWFQFKREIPQLSKINLSRRILSDHSHRCQIHGFCDASLKGYASVVYLRVETASGEIFTSLVYARAKVSPLKLQSLPRLELCGAKLLADIIAFVLNSYSGILHIDDVIAWSDSQVVLSWLSSGPHRWKTFVANRVSYIQEIIPAESWRYVPSCENPADCASRGLFPSQLVNHHLWWNGPSFLRLPSDAWSPHTPSIPCDQDVIQNEERKTVLTLVTEENSISKLLEKFSSLLKIQRILSYCLRFVKRNRSTDSPERDLQNSMTYLVRYVQFQHFPEIIKRLEENKLLPKPFRKLSLFLDENRCLRVGGRLTHSELSYNARHPFLLPSSNRLTQLIIEHVHRKYLHPGLTTLHYLLRQQFWILSARRAIQRTVSSCIRCFRVKPKASTQVMGDLPPHRVSQLKAFSHVAADFCGPFFITLGKHRGAKVSKAYICVFVCAATRAIHLEVTSDLSSETFLAAFKRLIARRGRISDLYSDCGTNFVGANRILTEHSRDVCDQLGVKWHFSPPAAPHFNGLSEAGVKSVKAHLRRVVGDQRLTFEEFYTFTCQIESILNSRPLYAMSSDPNDLLPLTPGHFLTLEPMCSLPEPDLSNVKISCLTRWRLLQRLQSDFWKRWHVEYLNTLQQRSKWTDPANEIKKNTLVLIKNEQSPPMRWALGRVIELHPGSDGHVRVVTLKTATGQVRRPVAKLCPLPLN